LQAEIRSDPFVGQLADWADESLFGVERRQARSRHHKI
jgi:hypothetical protein